MVHKPDEVVQEFQPIAKYRVRLLKNGNGSPVLDIREYVTSDGSNGFEGFTRRGIRLTDRTQMDLLRDILKEILQDLKSSTPSKPRKSRKGGRK